MTELVWNDMPVRVVKAYVTVEFTAYALADEDENVSAWRIGCEVADAIKTYAPRGKDAEDSDGLVVLVDDVSHETTLEDVTQLAEYSDEDMAQRVDGMHGDQSF